jgi:hypothetical protein
MPSRNGCESVATIISVRAGSLPSVKSTTTPIPGLDCDERWSGRLGGSRIYWYSSITRESSR